MRWRLTVLVAATTSAVVLAFLIPLALLLRTLAEDRAVEAVTSEAQNVAALAAATGTDVDRHSLDDLGAERLGPTTVIFPDGSRIGAQADDEAQINRAKAGQAFNRKVGKDVVVYVPAVGGAGVTVVRTVVAEDQLHRGVGRATAILAGLGLFLLLVSVAAADRLARRLSAPIRALAEGAEALHEGRLDTRSAERGPPEVIALATALNRLAVRIERLLVAERESVADLSHRLRTPVTALRLDTEAVTDPELAERLREHVANLERTVDAVVRDARRPVRSNVSASCDVARVVQERVTFWSALADEQGRALKLVLPPIPARAKIDALDLTDVVDVLIDNVFAHTEEGVPVEVTVSVVTGGPVVLTVEDGGPGFPHGDVIQRGLSEAGSSGLGLDIVRRAAIASGGTLELGIGRMGGALVRVVFGPAETRLIGRTAARKALRMAAKRSKRASRRSGLLGLGWAGRRWAR